MAADVREKVEDRAAEIEGGRNVFVGPLFDGRSIIPSGNTNYSLVGVKPSQAKSLGW